MTKNKSIIGWSLHVEWDNGKTEHIIDLEEFMSSSQIQGIDDSLRELETAVCDYCGCTPSDCCCGYYSDEEESK